VLFTRDYEDSPYSRKEFTSFEAERAQSVEERHIIVLRCEDVPLRGLLADNVYQDLVDITDPEERKRRIVAAAERQSQSTRPSPRPFIGVLPRIASLQALKNWTTSISYPRWAPPTQPAVERPQGLAARESLATEYAHPPISGVCRVPPRHAQQLRAPRVRQASTTAALYAHFPENALQGRHRCRRKLNI
jgi:hypothetical protein